MQNVGIFDNNYVYTNIPTIYSIYLSTKQY